MTQPIEAALLRLPTIHDGLCCRIVQRYNNSSVRPNTNDSAWEGGGTKRKLRLAIIAEVCNGYKYPGVFFSIRFNPITPATGLKDPEKYALDVEFVMS
jgi:hypothetical protein